MRRPAPPGARFVVLEGSVVVPARIAAELVGALSGVEVEDEEAAAVLRAIVAVGRVFAARGEAFQLPSGCRPVAVSGAGLPFVDVRPGGGAGSSPMDAPSGWERAVDVADRAGISRRTLRHRAAAGLVPAVKVRGAWWVDPAVVEG